MVTLRSQRVVQTIGGVATTTKITLKVSSKPEPWLSGRNVTRKRSRQATPVQGKIILKLRKVFIAERRKMRPVNLRTNKDDIVLGESRFLNFPGPEAKVYHKVFEILEKYHSNLDLKKKDKLALEAKDPAHAAKGVTIDGWIKVIMSQHTNNDLGETAHAEAAAAFPYLVNGMKVITKTPNYHDMRVAPLADVQKAFHTAGLHKRSAYIQDILQVVHQQNLAQMEDKSMAQEKNKLNAPDFVPGLLSIDFMNRLSKQEKYDKLVSFGIIGPKTAACILSFFYEYNVFAVDTHVYQMSRWLDWIPEDCSEIDAFTHLDAKVPNDIKHELHQAFWNHRQLCLRCKSKADKKSQEWKKAVCPLEHMLDRSRKTLKQVAEMVRVNKIKTAVGDFALKLAEKREKRSKEAAEKKARSPQMPKKTGEQVNVTITDNWGAGRNRNVLSERTLTISTQTATQVTDLENDTEEGAARMEIDIDVTV